MKKYVVIFFLILASASSAQPPRIDSMLVDEQKNILYIYGSFGWLQGLVEADSVRLKIDNWTDTLIAANIADTGKGSVGPVMVGASGYPSNKRVLTRINFSGYVSYDSIHQGGLYEISSEKFSFVWRYDLHSFFINHKYDDHLQIKIASGDIVSIEFAYYQGILRVNNWQQLPMSIDYDLQSVHEYPLDNYNPKLVHTEWSDPLLFYFPPDEARVLHHNILLISPRKDSCCLDPRNLELICDTLKYHDISSFATKYHFQISNNINFTNDSYDTVIVDTVVTGFSFYPINLSGNKLYYWRVAGINSEGESRWSDIWNFTTGATADVKSKNNSGMSVSTFPNPSSKELTISYSLSEPENARIILYDLSGRIIRESSNVEDLSEHQIVWDISQLANGSYILGLITNKENTSQIIMILH